ncbi:MAG: hypothetical protein IPK53_19745 [bacterium]|nr:hypothetical protein [bacterium]
MVVIDDYRKVIWQTNGGILNLLFGAAEENRKLLHVYWRAGQISVRGRKLMEEAIGEPVSEKFADIFKSNGIRNPAYGKGSLIEALQRGMIRLNIAKTPKGR